MINDSCSQMSIIVYYSAHPFTSSHTIINHDGPREAHHRDPHRSAPQLTAVCLCQSHWYGLRRSHTPANCSTAFDWPRGWCHMNQSEDSEANDILTASCGIRDRWTLYMPTLSENQMQEWRPFSWLQRARVGFAAAGCAADMHANMLDRCR